MTNYAGWVYPLPELFAQVLTTSLDDGLERWDGYQLVDMLEYTPIIGERAHSGSYPHVSHALAGHVMPTYADDLFGHIIIVPPRLDLGNLLSTQSRTLEIANLGTAPRDWSAVTNNAGEGIEFDAPSFPVTILPFGSYILEVSVTTDGPPSINGSIDFDFVDPEETILVPVTGTRIVVFEFIPQTDVAEVIEWATDVLEAYDATEQRISIRIAPRQRLQYTVATERRADMRMRALLFDWLPRVFGVPIWFEARPSANSALVGTLIIPVDTSAGDFRVGGLVMICVGPAPDDDAAEVFQVTTFDVLEIDTVDADQITTASALGHSYDAGALVMPMRTAYAQTMTSSSRYHGGFQKTQVEFVTLDNEALPDQAGATIYDGRVVLDDGNVVTDTLPDAFERPVIVIDNTSGRILQTSRTDRSRIKSRFMWDAPNRDEVWRVRRLLHSFYGSQKGFWVPSCRPDLELAQVIGPGATTFRIRVVGYTAFIGSRRPYGDVQFVLTNGTVIRRRVTGAEVEDDEEVLSVNTAISGSAIAIDEVARIELLMLARIADDEASIQHRRNGDATFTVQTITIKE